MEIGAVIQFESLIILKTALEVLTSVDGLPDVPYDQLKSFKLSLPTLVQDFQKAVLYIQDMKNKQSHFANLSTFFTHAME